MKIFRIVYMLLGLIFLAYGITFDDKALQIIGALFSFTVWLWEFFLRESENKRLRHRLEESDRALNIQRDEADNVKNNPFDMGTI